MFFTLLRSQPLKCILRAGPLRTVHHSFVFPTVPIIYSRNMAVRNTKHGHNSSLGYANLYFKTVNSMKITDWVKPGDKSGEFKRQQSIFRNWISREAGAQFPPEKGRYHLYVSYACPWGMKELPIDWPLDR